ncbi:50S ribosomal protein L18Ae [Nanobdella aerobiophila]|uniref:Large ribosomal subunit protein eL20 n=1 Tax=Nanobdella aerobiophila TaxID=2586965 RepID=A0A915SXX0_9ARCH|nr:50S ribosomal protein L18Ae [Nanobdella aerobiophila]BBL45365.1 50S ribosomal protein L18Ae [Nanobdella aerobiophila]
MEVKIYRVTGRINKVKIVHASKRKEGVITKRKIIYNFSKEVLGLNEKEVKERILSLFGSVYKVKRNNISIQEIKEIKNEDVTDQKLRKFLEMLKNGQL